MRCQSLKASSAAWTAVVMLTVQPQLFAQQVEAPAPAVQAMRPALHVVDVALDARGGLTGQISGAHGTPLVGATIAIDNGQQRLESVTGAHGQFHFEGLQGGAYRVEAVGQVKICRAWKSGTAPPSANYGLFIVQNSEIALGQSCGSPVAAGFAGAHEALANPLIFGGIVAAAIAIPVAIHNSDDDPAS